MFKFDDIVALSNVGVVRATSHTLTPSGAYTLTCFKTEVNRLSNEWAERYKEMAKDAGITDLDAFNKRYKELSAIEKKNQKEQKEFDEAKKKSARLNEIRKAMGNDEVKLNIKPMEWVDWFNLKQENKELLVNFYNAKGEIVDSRELFEFVEMLSENILWKAPTE